MDRTGEVSYKLDLIRKLIGGNEAVRLRGIDWFAWASAGGSSAVLLAAETGIAEIFISRGGAWVLTDQIESKRLADEELTANFTIQATSWAHPLEREHFIREIAGRYIILSDRPLPGEKPLPKALIVAKQTLGDLEVKRYQKVGRLAAEAMTEALLRALPGWSEWELAGAGSQALMTRGLHPALVLCAGEKRLPLYRQPTPTHELLGNSAMLVFCARMHGLYANITRFISFGKLPAAAAEQHRQVREIEACALKQSRPGAGLNDIYTTLAQAYAEAGHPQAIHEHHQGGTTGYLSREIVAIPGTPELLQGNAAIAWNPSLRGAKIEDTFVVTDQGLINLTFDRNWPTTMVAGIERPLVLEL
ncbi:MAG TPA: M24 family metallopeptidase [Negativicutes bacterium]|jgi:Xaa-Pro aminopeptidase